MFVFVFVFGGHGVAERRWSGLGGCGKLKVAQNSQVAAAITCTSLDLYHCSESLKMSAFER